MFWFAIDYSMANWEMAYTLGRARAYLTKSGYAPTYAPYMFTANWNMVCLGMCLVAVQAHVVMIPLAATKAWTLHTKS